MLGIPDLVRGVIGIGTIAERDGVRKSVVADPVTGRMSFPREGCSNGIV